MQTVLQRDMSKDTDHTVQGHEKDRKSSVPGDGVILLRKPGGPTSTACLNRIKSRFRMKKIGHAGTLDPLATGILVVLIGQATKLAQYFAQGPKTYSGTIRLGLTTDTYDIQGRILDEKDCSGVLPEKISMEIKSWENLMEQPIPPVSAAKHQGRTFHSLIRAGQKVPHRTKKIKVYRADVLAIDPPDVVFRITCTAGTYVRSLAHSLGMRLGCGAVLTELVREQSHPFTLDQAVDLEELLDRKDLKKHLLSIPEALARFRTWDQVTLSRDQEKIVRSGQPVDAQLISGCRPRENDVALLLARDGSPLALAEAKSRDDRLVWSIIRGLWT